MSAKAIDGLPSIIQVLALRHVMDCFIITPVPLTQTLKHVIPRYNYRCISVHELTFNYAAFKDNFSFYIVSL